MVIDHNEEKFKKKLTPEEYAVLRKGATEPAFTGKYVDAHESGIFRCKACGAELFSSDTKFDTNIPGLRGWPSFENAIPDSVQFREDNSLGMHRTEVICTKCGSHLGHLFDDDSETKTGKHYCINSCALDFKKEERNESHT